jgi:hypothetical protein
MRRPPLSPEQILAWADTYHARTGRWPHSGSGPVDGTDGQTWSAVNVALIQGSRGLPGGSSLARFLEAYRGKQRKPSPPPLTIGQILAWAGAHYLRTGRLPTAASGPVAEAPGENWAAINSALTNGHRGLPGGTSLSWLLAENGYEGVRLKRGRRAYARPLTEQQFG